MKRVLKTLAAIAALAGIGYGISYFRGGDVYRTYHSPDGLYTVEVVSYGGFHMGPPGSSGDRAGFVRLLDARGKVLKREEVEMVNQLSEPRWDALGVEMTADKWYYPGK